MPGVFGNDTGLLLLCWAGNRLCGGGNNFKSSAGTVLWARAAQVIEKDRFLKDVVVLLTGGDSLISVVMDVEEGGEVEESTVFVLTTEDVGFDPT